MLIVSDKPYRAIVPVVWNCKSGRYYKSCFGFNIPVGGLYQYYGTLESLSYSLNGSGFQTTIVLMMVNYTNTNSILNEIVFCTVLVGVQLMTAALK